MRLLEPFEWHCTVHDSRECGCSPAWRLTCLAHNLAIAGGLCEAWSRAAKNLDLWWRGEEVQWRPGCNLPPTSEVGRE